MATTYNTDDAHFASIITKEVFAEYAEDEGIHASKFRELLLEYDRKEKTR